MATSCGVRPASTAGASGSICQVRMYFSPTRRPMQGWTRVSLMAWEGLSRGRLCGGGETPVARVVLVEVMGVEPIAEIRRNGDRQLHLRAGEALKNTSIAVRRFPRALGPLQKLLGAHACGAVDHMLAVV